MIVVLTETRDEAAKLRALLLAADPSGRMSWRVAAIGGQLLPSLRVLLETGCMSDSAVAHELGCSTRTVRRLVAAGELVRVGRKISASSVVEYVQRRDAALIGGARWPRTLMS